MLRALHRTPEGTSIGGHRRRDADSIPRRHASARTRESRACRWPWPSRDPEEEHEVAWVAWHLGRQRDQSDGTRWAEVSRSIIFKRASERGTFQRLDYLDLPGGATMRRSPCPRQGTTADGLRPERAARRDIVRVVDRPAQDNSGCDPRPGVAHRSRSRRLRCYTSETAADECPDGAVRRGSRWSHLVVLAEEHDNLTVCKNGTG